MSRLSLRLLRFIPKHIILEAHRAANHIIPPDTCQEYIYHLPIAPKPVIINGDAIKRYHRFHMGLCNRFLFSMQSPTICNQTIMNTVTLLEREFAHHHNFSSVTIFFPHREDKHFIGLTSSTPNITQWGPANCERFTWKQTTSSKENTLLVSSRWGARQISVLTIIIIFICIGGGTVMRKEKRVRWSGCL